jgi:3'(2'), 5'-bisphosphate nucleotidase
VNGLDREVVLDRVLPVAERAAALIRRIYGSAFNVEYKGREPVTIADREANTLICSELAALYPGVPLVAEESDPATFAGYAAAPAVWFIDPLDGTREFIAKNGEFAVMIGLAEAGRATLGVIVCPALGRSFLGAEGVGAYEVASDGSRRAVRTSTVSSLAKAELVVSRSHGTESLEAVAAQYGVGKLIRCGSAGVKAVRVATGEADVYAQPGRAGKLWDACAPEALVRAAGGLVTHSDGTTIDYAAGALENDAGFIATNGPLQDSVLGLLRGLVKD